MTILLAIVNFLATLLGSSAFSDAMHALFGELNAKADIPKLDSALVTALQLLHGGTMLETVIQQLIDQYGLDQHHAAMVVAGAQAVKTREAAATVAVAAMKKP
jgi:hypothetical protein